jgi:uncharacterized membrane protein YebE (DUF533 family)
MDKKKLIFIGLMVAGGGVVAYSLWKDKQKSKLNMSPGWKPGDDIAVTTSNDDSLLEVKMPEMNQKDLLAQYGINT